MGYEKRVIHSFHHLLNATSAIRERLGGQARHENSQPLETCVNVTTALSRE